MSQQFLGEVRLFPYNFAPKTWVYCAGQLLPIQQNTALFSLLGTTYGGNGIQTFGLPDLRGRAFVGTGSGYIEGQAAGSETVSLIQSQIPLHNHSWTAMDVPADAVPPTNNYLAQPKSGGNPVSVYGAAANLVPLAPTTIGMAGGSQPHDNMQPYLVLAYCIALAGIFPSRN